MNLIGKIAIVAILIMSVVFMSLSLMVYATHRNWREYAENTDTSQGKELGVKPRLDNQLRVNRELQLQIDRKTTELQMERAARQQALAVLEARASRLQEELNKKIEDLATLRHQHDSAVATMELAQNNLAKLGEEVGQLRQQIRDAEQDRDDQFARVVGLLDRSNQLEGLRRQLEERNSQLTDRVGKMNRVLQRFGLSETTPLHEVPPKVFGEVRAVQGTNLVEISLGTDDGLRVGHTLDVYRPAGGTYVGRVEVTHTDPDRSVARVLREFRQGIIRKGDVVATRLVEVGRAS